MIIVGIYILFQILGELLQAVSPCSLVGKGYKFLHRSGRGGCCGILGSAFAKEFSILRFLTKKSEGALYCKLLVVVLVHFLINIVLGFIRYSKGVFVVLKHLFQVPFDSIM